MSKLLKPRLPKHAVLLFAAFLALVPTIFMVSTALKTRRGICDRQARLP